MTHKPPVAGVAPPPQGTAPKSGDPQRAPLPSTAPLALWLVLQLGVFALVVCQIPLAAQYAEPAETLAAHLLLGAQVVAAALLFPFLLRDARTAVQIIAAAWPFQLAAGYLAGMSLGAIVWPAVLVTAWLATLALSAPLLRSPRGAAAGTTLAVVLTVGLAALRYLRVEFGGGGAGPLAALEDVSPLLSTFQALEGFSPRRAWIPLALLLGLSIAAVSSRSLVGRRDATGVGSTPAAG